MTEFRFTCPEFNQLPFSLSTNNYIDFHVLCHRSVKEHMEIHFEGVSDDCITAGLDEFV